MRQGLLGLPGTLLRVSTAPQDPAPPAPAGDAEPEVEPQPVGASAHHMATRADSDALGAAEIVALAAPSTTRRAPRYGRFALAGVLVGALLSALAAILGPAPENLGRGTIFILVFLALGSIGALIGVLIAIAADRRSLRPPRP